MADGTIRVDVQPRSQFPATILRVDAALAATPWPWACHHPI